MSEFVRKQQRNYCEHVIRMPLHGSLKKLLFNEDKNIKRGRQSKTPVELVLEHDNITLNMPSFIFGNRHKSVQLLNNQTTNRFVLVYSVIG